MRRICFLLLFALAFPVVGDEVGTTNAPPKQKTSLKTLLTDPEDGNLDLSTWLGTATGVLPLPLIITEPAVGYGGGLALLYFHDKAPPLGTTQEEKGSAGTKQKRPPPSMSGVAAIATENGTWGGAAFHAGVWKEDTIRYLGALGYVSLNYDFYPSFGGVVPLNLEGTVFIQQALFRLGKSNFFMGTNYKFLSATVTLDGEISLPPPFSDGVSIQSGGASGILLYDTRDNVFTPNHGLSSKTEWTHYDTWLGSDNQFDILASKNRGWYPLTESLILGLRGDAAFSGGDTPFYMKPFIFMRGIPAMRYQGDYVLTVETELRWDVTQRWSLLGFAGAGWVANDSLSNFENSETHPAAGFGFRYLVARALNFRSGIDVGFSEEDTAIYLTFGTAWAL